MTKLQNIVEQLSLFNNRSFTKKQWEIILKGCGCPKSSYFWMALRNNNLECYNSKAGIKIFTLLDMNTEALNTVWEQYCKANRAGVKRAFLKNKARKNAEERRKNFKGVTFYMIGGALSTDKPELDI